ncbi:7113_t:CDS:2, partial [Racocetra persica]
YIHPILYEMSVKEFFQKLTEEILVLNLDFEQVKSIEISKSTNSTEAIPTSSDCNIIKLTNTFGANIYYHLKEEQIFYNYQNGLDIFMQTARQKNKLYVPNFTYADNQGKQFVFSLSEILWYLDIRNHKNLKIK